MPAGHGHHARRTDTMEPIQMLHWIENRLRKFRKLQRRRLNDDHHQATHETTPLKENPTKTRDDNTLNLYVPPFKRRRQKEEHQEQHQETQKSDNKRCASPETLMIRSSVDGVVDEDETPIIVTQTPPESPQTIPQSPPLSSRVEDEEAMEVVKQVIAKDNVDFRLLGMDEMIKFKEINCLSVTKYTYKGEERNELLVYSADYCYLAGPRLGTNTIRQKMVEYLLFGNSSRRTLRVRRVIGHKTKRIKRLDTLQKSAWFDVEMRTEQDKIVWNGMSFQVTTLQLDVGKAEYFFEVGDEKAEIDVDDLDPDVPARRLIEASWIGSETGTFSDSLDDGSQSAKTSQEGSWMSSETDSLGSESPRVFLFDSAMA